MKTQMKSAEQAQANCSNTSCTCTRGITCPGEGCDCRK